jgi:hypothetical protein
MMVKSKWQRFVMCRAWHATASCGDRKPIADDVINQSRALYHEARYVAVSRVIYSPPFLTTAGLHKRGLQLLQLAISLFILLV